MPKARFPLAFIAMSGSRLATLTGAMCKTSQCELRSLRVNSGMLNVIRIVTYYTLPPLESPDSFWIAMSINAYGACFGAVSAPTLSARVPRRARAAFEKERFHYGHRSCFHGCRLPR